MSGSSRGKGRDYTTDDRSRRDLGYQRDSNYQSKRYSNDNRNENSLRARRRSKSPDQRGSRYDDRRRDYNNNPYRFERRQDYRSNERYPPPPRESESEIPAPRREREEDFKRNQLEKSVKASNTSGKIEKADQSIISNNNKNKEESNELDEEEQLMMNAMGFGGFGSTKGQKVKGNEQGYAEIKKEHSWRQYMQRKGGFNRPLSPVRD